MHRWFRRLAVLALVATTSAASGAGAQPEGDTFPANLFVSIDVVGDAPPGTELVLDLPGVVPPLEPSTITFTPEDAGEERLVPDFMGGDKPILVADDGGADAVGFACGAIVGNGTCEVLADRIRYGFSGGQPTEVHARVTFTFGSCDGRPITAGPPGPGNDVILGTPAAETINGHGGNDVICGRGGADTIRGGDGRDRVFGGGGNDRLEGGKRGDWLLGGPGADTLLGLAGNDALDGGAQRDTCKGGTERDTAARCEVRTGIP